MLYSRLRAATLLACLALTAACSMHTAKPETYLSKPTVTQEMHGPITLPVTSILVEKSARRMSLLNGPTVLRSYDIDLGFRPNGNKIQRGDGRTPEGTYYIDRRNPQSAYHLSVGISYPNPEDRRIAAARGVNPGGDIFIHGKNPRTTLDERPDWTEGCIAVEDHEIREIYETVELGTPITIIP